MSIFTRYAMDALMKTTHPEVNRKQCWNLHPHRTPCTACKDICPYGDEIFTRPNLVKDWASRPAGRAALPPRRSRCSGTSPLPTAMATPSGSAAKNPPGKTPWCAPASRPIRGKRWPTLP